MDWIKRNLYFLIGSLAALLLMGLAGWYLFSNYRRNTEMLGKLNEQYESLNTLNNQNPHPGNPPKGPDNIQAAKEQQEQLREFVKKSRKFFQSIPPIPATESGKVSSQEFVAALRSTMDRMQHDATNASVALPQGPQRYNFSFEAVINKFTHPPGSLGPLSTQLGEVKVICDSLFQTKVNSLDSLRRERVSTDDNSGPPSDYLQEKSVTNELAVLSPYELTFRCFTPELAGVLASFASSPYGLLVRTINVELAPAPLIVDAPLVTPTPVFTAPAAIPSPAASAQAEADAFRRRYGLSPGSRAGEGGAAPINRNPFPVAPPPAAVATAPATKGGLPTVIDEKQLKVTMTLHVVKLIPPPAAKGQPNPAPAQPQP